MTDELSASPPPLPVAPLDYALHDTRIRRPGLVTALAIVGIIVSLLSVAASSIAGYAFLNCAAKSTPPAPPPPPAPLPPVNLTPYTGQIVRPRGLSARDRSQLTKSLTLREPFAEDRRVMADRLLAEAGRDIIGDLPVSAAQFVTKAHSADQDVWAADVVETPAGTMTLDNKSAVFAPADPHNLKPTRVDWDIVTDGASTHWCSAVLDKHIGTLRSSLDRVTPFQIAAILKQLDANAIPAPRRKFIGFHAGQTYPFNYASVSDAGILTVNIGPTNWTILPDGRSITTASVPMGIDAARGAPNLPPAKRFIPYLPGSPLAMRATAWHAVGSAGLGLLLFAASILTLLSSRFGPLWQLRWVGLKYIAIVVEIAVSIWLIQSCGPAGMSTRRGMIAMQSSIVPFSITLAKIAVISTAIAQSILPTATLFVLFSGSCRRWYSTIAPSAESAATSRIWRAMAWLAALVAGLFGLVNLSFGGWFGYNEQLKLDAIVIHIVVGGSLLVASLIAIRNLRAAARMGGYA